MERKQMTKVKLKEACDKAVKSTIELSRNLHRMLPGGLSPYEKEVDWK